MAKIIDNNLKAEESLNNNSLNQATPHPSPKSEKSIVDTLGSILPFVPMVYEQFTGKKIPALTGTLAEMQNTISQLTLSCQQIIANQQQIFTKLTSLETNANQQLLSLDKRLENLQSLKLTHERESKRIEYNPRKSLETTEEDY